MYSYGPPHMAGQKQEDQQEHTFSSYVRIRDVALKTCQRQKWWDRVRDIRAGGMTWWWWWWWCCAYTHLYIYTTYTYTLTHFQGQWVDSNLLNHEIHSISLKILMWKDFNFFSNRDIFLTFLRNDSCSRGVVVNVLDYDVIVSEFEFQRGIMFTFGLIPVKKVWTLLSPNYELIPLLLFYYDGFGII